MQLQTIPELGNNNISSDLAMELTIKPTVPFESQLIKNLNQKIKQDEMFELIDALDLIHKFRQRLMNYEEYKLVVYKATVPPLKNMESK